MYKLLENEKQSIVTENMLVVTLGPEGSSAGKRDYNDWKENLRIWYVHYFNYCDNFICMCTYVYEHIYMSKCIYYCILNIYSLSYVKYTSIMVLNKIQNPAGVSYCTLK